MLKRGLLLDRDGVINRDHGYVGKRADFQFMPGLFPFLRAASERGYRLAILTNQSGVARGLFSREDYNDLTQWMLAEFMKQGIAIDLTLVCFEHPAASIEVYRRDSFWRKPNPGMVLEAIQRLRLDTSRSAFLGDQLRDMEAAKTGGIQHCLWLKSGEQPVPPGITAVRDFNEALAVLLDC